MITLPRWLASAVLAAGVGVAGFTPVPAQAQGDDLVRVIVDIADVVLRGGQPYYRYGDYGYDDRLVVSRDRYGRPIYYRTVPRTYAYDRPDVRRTKCNKHGKCKVEYYDPRYDRRHDDRYYGYDDRRYRSRTRYRYDD